MKLVKIAMAISLLSALLSAAPQPPSNALGFINLIDGLLKARAVATRKPYNKPSLPPYLSAEQRMEWWREARFGLFIHWGLYSVPAGEWDGKTSYGEWILNSAKIPVSQYENFKTQFNPTKFDADAWVKMAVDAGFKYIVITTKHHDGFCLFDSELTDWSITSTPFKRDIIKEIAEACKKQDIKLGLYYSVMDWHHPDYLPRRPWEDRPSDGAKFDDYVTYMKGQLKELLTRYGPVWVLWYDGSWEHAWTREMGLDLYNYTRSFQPRIIVNNRADKGGATTQMTVDNLFAGDYQTPEQRVPPMGLPGIDWETCMTMNDHWGYNSADKNWKSGTELIRTLIDVASKGGNLLLNVGPMATGEIPQASVERLFEIGRWMKVNGESIYGTQANPFPSLDFGRCTRRNIDSSATRLYFHVFDWPKNGTLKIPGLYNKVTKAYLLSNSSRQLKVVQREGQTEITVPAVAPDDKASVVAVEISGAPDIALPPAINAAAPIFDKELEIVLFTGRQNVVLRYSLDGSEPTAEHPIVSQGKIIIDKTCTIKVRAFRDKTPVSPTSEAAFKKVIPKPSVKPDNLADGVDWSYFEGSFKLCEELKEPKDTGTSVNFTIEPAKRLENYGFRFNGYIDVPATGVFTFFTTSDDGTCLWIDGEKIVDNDGIHRRTLKSGMVALEKGLHAIRVDYFQRNDSAELKIHWEGPDVPKQAIGDNDLKRDEPKKQ
ncbi:MAG: alpha-L-fucosidase [Holophagales bacterium]|jgi:alpha-L-fucosidase|nr:alpha-L-fucosidase [Holophagales bacterium]